jgi:hypothetical protein
VIAGHGDCPGELLHRFQDFLLGLEGLDWRPPGHIDPRMLDLLAEVGRKPRLVQETVSSWNLKDLDKRQLRCHETSTHYKWFVYYHPKHHYRIWLHQYKLRGERRLGHAEVPHNHRYSLASVIMRGGFVHHSFEQMDGGLVELAHDRHHYRQGDAYSVDWKQLHRLSDLSDHTLTLVVESPIVRHFSEAFYGESSTPDLFYDFVALHKRLSDEMTCL